MYRFKQTVIIRYNNITANTYWRFILGNLYILGCQEEYQLGHSNVDVVSLETGEATKATSMLEPRIDPAVATSSSSIFVFGG